ncbi:hypothetical protein B0181_01685 [Moraxella caviae]|uniref:Uncharacterized protein n=1 Tax=Moraxella caviae TaxID=34060 RepID=A0A1T0A9T8_9GAMM|nr:hypothetical protein [Moraxella caviae]OOR92428.1 hypothetical protein B0181_01685 [Moraxella caviae]STZ13662.1 Uncharacterised protein [Moraxella caviae]VEW10162.1 Uncharacterised protein [Moraxella caviae]
MIDFNFYTSNKQVGGLNFQICYSVNKEIIYKKSLVINEDLFSLIQDDFSLCYCDNNEKYNYYHWGVNFHDKQDIECIIKRLNYRLDKINQNNINNLNYSWLDEDCVEFLNTNKINFKKFIEYVIDFINIFQINEYDGIYVIGV